MSNLAHPLLARGPVRKRPGLALLPDLEEAQLPFGRVHEGCGIARYTLALWLAAQTQGPVIWIAPSWLPHRLNPDGFAPLLDPARLMLAQATRPEDILWSVEEVLRSGIVALTVADLPGLPSLTQVRRMHLAAEQGGQKTGAGPGHAPLALLLTPGEGGCAGVETRWHLAPQHGRHLKEPAAPPPTPHAYRTAWRLTRLRARTAAHKHWTLVQSPNAPLPVPASAQTPPEQSRLERVNA